MKKINLILLGAGGHARSCIDVIERSKKFKIIGLINNKKESNYHVFNYTVIGEDKDLNKFRKKAKHAFICVGQIKTSMPRINLYDKLIKAGFKLPIIISPYAYISRHAKIDKGTIIMHGAVVNAGAQIGKNCIINTNSLIEHDVIVGDHCHVSTGAILNGNVFLGNKSFIGSGSVIRDGVSIGNSCVIGANTFVKQNLASNRIYKKNK